jgi:classical protein kinase C
MNDDEKIQDIYKKIEREKALINAGNAMRASTNNEAVRSRIDSQMRDARRNVQFFEERLRELQIRQMNKGMGDMSMGPGGRPMSGDMRDSEGAPIPPPKDSSSWGGAGYGTQQYSQIGGHGDLMPPRHPYGPPGPGPAGAIPKPRPNFTKLGT